MVPGIPAIPEVPQVPRVPGVPGSQDWVLLFYHALEVKHFESVNNEPEKNAERTWEERMTKMFGCLKYR